LILGHKRNVNDILIFDNSLCSGDEEGYVKKFRVDTGELIWSSKVSGVVFSLIKQGTNVMISDRLNSYRKVDIETGFTRTIVFGLSSATPNVVVLGNVLFMGCDSSDVIVWDIKSQEVLFRLSGNIS
jgi:outer membrane protein assembly factor BamB